MSGDLGDLSVRFVERSKARDLSKRFHGREERWWELGDDAGGN
jgi:hypothetical protein